MIIEGYEGEFLSKEDIVYLHDRIIDLSEFKEDKGFIDINGNLFDGSYNGIFASMFGQDRYPTIEEKCVGLCYAIISNHCFCNGNKRTGVFAMIQMFDMNGIDLQFEQEEMFDLITKVGSHEINFEDFYTEISKMIKLAVKEDKL